MEADEWEAEVLRPLEVLSWSPGICRTVETELEDGNDMVN